MKAYNDFFTYLQSTPLYNYGRLAFYGLIAASWIWCVVYTLHDSERRFQRHWPRLLVVLLPLFGWLPGFFIYLFLRPSETVTDRMYQKFLMNTVKLQENPSLCPTCRDFVKSDFIFCPHCGNQVLTVCSSCRRPLRLDWKHCPGCGGKQ